MSNFIHLHNHSDFSLLDSSQSIDSILKRANDLSMNSIALTESSNLFSMISFYKAAQKYKIKPILGCEIIIDEPSYFNKQTGNSLFQLVLLAKNNTGYSNLMKLVSESYLTQSSSTPYISREILEKFSDGLIAMSSGLKGATAYYASLEDYENAKNIALSYKRIFNNNFYLEMQNHLLKEEIIANKILHQLSKELDISLVATNNTRYTFKEDAPDYEVIHCIGMGVHLNSSNKPPSLSPEYYIKSSDEMSQLFKDYPKALENSVKIAEQCNVEIPMGQLFLPKFDIPPTSKARNDNDYLKELCEISAIKKYSKINKEVSDRLQYELDIIYKMGFASYFLITQDFVKYAKDNDIPVGPGRGSAVGSLVSYLIGITDLDPLEYNLIFERFLNPDRISMPDIDIDFCIEGRDKVINYIKDRYGKKSVAQIITFGSMKAKSVIRDVGRVLGMSYGEVDKIAKMIPNDLKMTIDKALSLNKDLDKLVKQDTNCNKLISHSKKLEGLHRHASTHAAGIVIAPGPLMDYVPLFKNPSTNDITTQIEMNSLEEMGLLKMDFLGLRNLTVIDKTIKMVNQNHNQSLTLDDIDLSDPKVYKLFGAGNTIGIFQFESRGMRDYLKKLNPTCIQDLIAMNSLYRPGPMANIPDFLSRKNNNENIEYLHPKLEPILKETYGIIVYQEQVMQIGSVIGGFTLAQSDAMRKAMGKKKKDLMATFKIDFIKGAQSNGLSETLAIEIFDLLAKFAEYGFNKSHSAAYSIIAYQTAWLKTYYQSEFMACNLSSELLNTDTIIKLLRNIKKLDINILPPNINTSDTEFIAKNDGAIEYGLAAIKNVGYKSTQKLVGYRKTNGPFKTIFDLCKLGSQAINKKVLESLIKSGACDCLEGTRSQMYKLIDKALKFGQRYYDDYNSNQSNLFANSSSSPYSYPTLPDINDWSKKEKLNYEKEVLGFYLSGNPLEEYLDELKTFTNVGIINTDNLKFNKYAIGGRVFDVKILYDKKNNPWSISRLECYNGLIVELFIFNDTYIKYKDFLVNDNIIYCEGEPSNKTDDDAFKVIPKKIFNISYIREKLVHHVNVKIHFDINDDSIIDQLYDMGNKFPGDCTLVLHVINNKGKSEIIKSNDQFIASDQNCLKYLRATIGDQNVWLS